MVVQDASGPFFAGRVCDLDHHHEVAGEDCFYIKVRTQDTESLGALLRGKLKAIPNVVFTRTTVVLKTFKEGSNLPVELEAEGSEDLKRKARGK